MAAALAGAVGTVLVLVLAGPATAGTLVFTSERGTPRGASPPHGVLWTVEDDGSNLRPLTPLGDGYHLRRDSAPDWSPDGRSIVYLRFAVQSGLPAGPGPGFPQTAADQNGLFVTTPDGGTGRMILSSHVQEPGRPWTEQGWKWIDRPDWSPDGRTIAFESTRTDGGGVPGPAWPRLDTDIFLVGADGSGLRRVAAGPGYEKAPRFSADGRRVEFYRSGVAGGAAPGTGSDSGIYSVALDGSDERRHTIGFEPRPSYSPDGRWVGFGYGGELHTMRADGTERRVFGGWRGFGDGVDPTVAWSAEAPVAFFSSAPVSDPSDSRGVTTIGSRIWKVDLRADDPQPVQITGMDGVAGDYGIDATGDPTPLPNVDRSPPAVSFVGTDLKPAAAPTISRADTQLMAFDASGIGRLQVAVAREGRRRKGKLRCRFMSPRAWSKVRPCARPVWIGVHGTKAWSRQAGRLGDRTFLVGLRATDVLGNATPRPRLRRYRVGP